jgi:hypothetical protein
MGHMTRTRTHTRANPAPALTGMEPAMYGSGCPWVPWYPWVPWCQCGSHDVHGFRGNYGFHGFMGIKTRVGSCHGFDLNNLYCII